MINPMKLMKMKNAWSRFAAHHPKFPLFLNAIVRKGIQEGTIFEFKVTSPDGQELVTNMRLSSEDIELWKEISEAMRYSYGFISCSYPATPDASPTC